MQNKITYKITNNNDWNNLKENETLVDISNNSYFAYRAMEKNVKSIIYDPKKIDSIIRVIKDSCKFKNTKHILILDEKTIGYDASKSEVEFLKAATRVIEDIFEINPLLCIGFLLKMSPNRDISKVLSILNQIYNN